MKNTTWYIADAADFYGSFKTCVFDRKEIDLIAHEWEVTPEFLIKEFKIREATRSEIESVDNWYIAKDDRFYWHTSKQVFNSYDLERIAEELSTTSESLAKTYRIRKACAEEIGTHILANAANA